MAGLRPEPVSWPSWRISARRIKPYNLLELEEFELRSPEPELPLLLAFGPRPRLVRVVTAKLSPATGGVAIGFGVRMFSRSEFIWDFDSGAMALNPEGEVLFLWRQYEPLPLEEAARLAAAHVFAEPDFEWLRIKYGPVKKRNDTTVVVISGEVENEHANLTRSEFITVLARALADVLGKVGTGSRTGRGKH